MESCNGNDPKEETMSKESPIFIKTFDCIKRIIELTERFPKSQRFYLGKRVNDAAFDFYDILVEAAVISAILFRNRAVAPDPEDRRIVRIGLPALKAHAMPAQDEGLVWLRPFRAAGCAGLPALKAHAIPAQDAGLGLRVRRGRRSPGGAAT